MKKIIFIISTLFVFCTNNFSQDIIIQRDGTKIEGKVLEIKVQDISYKLKENPDGPTRHLSTQDVAAIRYENGYMETFSEVPQTVPKEDHSTSQQQPQPEYQKEIPEKETSSLQEPLGWIAEGGLSINFPLNADIAGIYGVFLGVNLKAGYWWSHGGLEGNWDFFKKTGNPYRIGNVQSATSNMEITSIDFSCFYATGTYKPTFFYIGRRFWLY